MYRTVTRTIEVKVAPRFLPDRSSPENGYFFWAYTITLTNLGSETVQLKTRHWRITDALGRLQEVRGAGVIGKEPVLKPGEDFEYTSGVPLPTPSGFMAGTYGMVTAAGEPFRYRDSGLFPRHAPGRAHDQLTATDGSGGSTGISHGFRLEHIARIAEFAGDRDDPIFDHVVAVVLGKAPEHVGNAIA